MIKKSLFFFALTIILVIISYAVAIFILCDPINSKQIFCSKITLLTNFYGKNIRGHLFAGFLALGGFLLSLKTFIIVNMKENIYDNKEYQKNWKKQSKLDSKLKLYAPLKELSDLLFYSILASITSAILQMTLGFYPHWIASITCIWSSIYAITLLLSSLLLIKKNLNMWFRYLEEENTKSS